MCKSPCPVCILTVVGLIVLALAPLWYVLSSVK